MRRACEVLGGTELGDPAFQSNSGRREPQGRLRRRAARLRPGGLCWLS